MLKIAISAALLCCSAATVAADATPAQPKPVLIGDPVADAPKVCALHFLENVGKIKMGQAADSPFITNYAAQYKLTPAQTAALQRDCDMFDDGILFYAIASAPPQAPEEDNSRWNPGPRGVLTSF